MTQKQFFDKQSEYAKRTTHGGDTRISKRKLKRPLDKKKAVHIVAKAEKAKGKYSLLNGYRKVIIKQIIDKFAAENLITVHAFQNVGNHLHIFVSFRFLGKFQNFLRTVLGLIARGATGAEKGSPFGKFWDKLIFTRVIQGYRDFKGVVWYIEKNRVEAEVGSHARKQIEDFEQAQRKLNRKRRKTKSAETG